MGRKPARSAHDLFPYECVPNYGTWTFDDVTLPVVCRPAWWPVSLPQPELSAQVIQTSAGYQITGEDYQSFNFSVDANGLYRLDQPTITAANPSSVAEDQQTDSGLLIMATGGYSVNRFITRSPTSRVASSICTTA